MTVQHPDTGGVDVGRLDGNAAAGALGELFRFDVTTARAECGHCGSWAMLAEAQVELDDDGLIVLCRSCGHTLLTYVWRPTRVLHLPALRSLTID